MRLPPPPLTTILLFPPTTARPERRINVIVAWYPPSASTPLSSSWSSSSSSSCLHLEKAQQRQPPPIVGEKCSAAALNDHVESSTTRRQYTALIDWVNDKSTGATIVPAPYVHPNFEIRPSSIPGGGFGGFAAAKMRAGETLLVIPEEACVTIYNAIGDFDCGEGIKNWLRTESGRPGRYVSGTTAALAAYLAKEWLLLRGGACGGFESDGGAMGSHVEPVDGQRETSESEFGPYLMTLPWHRGSILPGQEEHALSWSDERCASLLRKSSTLCKEVDAMRSEVMGATRALNPIVADAIQKHQSGNAKNASKSRRDSVITRLAQMFLSLIRGRRRRSELRRVVEGTVKLAFASVLSRSFATDVFSERMIPVLDMLNHAPVSSIVQRTDDWGNIVVTLAVDVESGDEIFNRYAALDVEDVGGGDAAHVCRMGAEQFFARFGFWPSSC